MSILNQYVIPIQGLDDGEYQYHFVMEKAFFDEFKSDIYQAKAIDALIRIEKRGRQIVAGFHLTGAVNLICDRCLEPFDFVLDNSYTLYFKTGTEESDDPESDIIFLHENEQNIAISQYLFEFIDFSLPLRKVHRHEKDCNTEMMKILKNHLVNQHDDNDPRWNKLKELL